jgi:lipopolysaccharide transport system permease protein
MTVKEETNQQYGADSAENEPAPPVKTTIIKRTRGLAALQLGEVWEFRELLYIMAWREVKVRYKQTVLGLMWILLRPVLSMVVFTAVFGNMLGVDSEGVPYPVFSYAALLPWTYFATSLTRASTSLVASSHLITKVYFPRLLVPMSEIVSGLIDFGVSFLVLIALMVFYGLKPTSAVVFLPLFLLLAMVTALGFGLWLGALNVRYRDINYVVPFMVQLWMYLTPVLYGEASVPESARFLLGLNPMTGVVQGFRWALLGNYLDSAPPSGTLFMMSVGVAVFVLVTGAYFFRVTERTFADVV